LPAARDISKTSKETNQISKQLTDDDNSFHECIVQADDPANAVSALIEATCIV
jgi:hypothetical protein